MQILEYIGVIGLICLICICPIIMLHEQRKRQNLESIFYYYRWHNALFDCPYNNTWYLAQTNDKEQKIKVLFYNSEENQWNYFGEVIAWCHLPNYLYPKQNIPNKV